MEEWRKEGGGVEEEGGEKGWRNEGGGVKEKEGEVEEDWEREER